MTGYDAAEFVLAGASAVALGTTLLADPTSWRRITSELMQWLDQERVGSLDEVVGAANSGFGTKKARETHLAGRE